MNALVERTQSQDAVQQAIELAHVVGKKAEAAALKAARAGLLKNHWNVKVFRAGGKIRVKVSSEDEDS